MKAEFLVFSASDNANTNCQNEVIH